MFMNDIDIFPHPEDVLWLMVSMVVAQLLRKYVTSRWQDDGQRVLVYEGLASAESMASRFALDLRKANGKGIKGLILWMGMNWFLGHLRSLYWKRNEVANPAKLLGMAYAHDPLPEANGVMLVFSQLVGGVLGYLFMYTFSYTRTIPRCCRLPMKVSVFLAFGLEVFGTLFCELLDRGFQNTQCDVRFHEIIIKVTKMIVDCYLKVKLMDLSGAVFHPVAALITLHHCILVKYRRVELFGVYVAGPCIGSLLAVVVAPRMQRLIRNLHLRVAH